MFRRALVLLLLVCACTQRDEQTKRVIFVGLDGADFRLLDRFVADGTMPRLGEILKRSERRVLLTQHPPLSPLVWTSMMTGVSPLEHRILDFTRFHPVTRAQEPITSDERAVPAIWNMAASKGKRIGVFGMWATFPPEPGIVLTHRDLPRDYIEATNLTHQRATKWIAEEKPDLAIVYFQGTDEIGHLTGGDIEKARAYFADIDRKLGDYQQLADELIVASDHGFDWGGKHDESSTNTATAAKWHRAEGVFIRWRREEGSRVEGRGSRELRAAEICSILLEALGLPADVREYRRGFKRVAPAEGGDANEQVAKLKALGYIGSAAAAPANASGTRTPASFNNEGLILREAKRIDEAERAFEEALRLDPAYPSPRQNLDDLRASRGVERLRANDCRGALADLRRVSKESALLWASIAAAEGCLGNDAAAEEAVRRSLAIDPNQPELRRLVLH
jgi:tetratricopeptide (TPR) repeat protein